MYMYMYLYIYMYIHISNYIYTHAYIHIINIIVFYSSRSVSVIPISLPHLVFPSSQHGVCV